MAPRFDSDKWLAIFLKHDGSVPMTDDLNMATHDILDVGTIFFGTGATPPKIYYDADAPTGFRFMAGASFVNIAFSKAFCSTIEHLGSSGSFQTGAVVTDFWTFKSYDGSEYQTCATLIGGQLQLNRALVDALSEITPDAGITIDGVLLKDNIATMDELKVGSFTFKDYSASTLSLMNAAGTDLRHLRINYLIFGKPTSKILITDGGVLASPAVDSATYDWYADSSAGAGFVHVLHVVGGNVMLPNLPVADPSIEHALWNDGGILKVSAG